MREVVFCDESGITKPHSCYSIAALAIREEALIRFNAYFERSIGLRGIQGEVKWSSVKKGLNLINFILDITRKVLRSPHTRFGVITVRKDLYRKWVAGGEDLAFYTTYTLLLNNRLGVSHGANVVLMDRRDTKYTKHDEVVHKIANYMAARTGSPHRIEALTKTDSKAHPGVQVADVLAGAVNTACDSFLRGPSAAVHPGKALVIERLARTLGLPSLACDTYPHPDANLWHFPDKPAGWRGVPSSEAIRPDYGVPDVTHEELEAALSAHVNP